MTKGNHMINHERLLAVLHEAAESVSTADVIDDAAQEILAALEQHGYAVVRAGMVPSLEPLVDVSERLSRLGNRSGAVQHDSAAAANAAELIRELRLLACTVLDIDTTDVDPEED